MLRSITIKNLFGRFNYSLSFSDKNIIIITGPNGYGKSTILRLINVFCSNNFNEFLKFNFKSVAIKCDNCEIKIEKLIKHFKINNFSFNNVDSFQFDRFCALISKRRFNDYDDIELFMLRHRNNLIDEMSRTKFDGEINDLFFKYLIHRNPRQKEETYYRQTIDAYRAVLKVRKSIGAIQFIQEQRLIEKKTFDNHYTSDDTTDIKYVTVINENSERLKSKLDGIMREHSSLSNELDSTYIKRLIEADLSDKYDINEIEKELKALSAKQQNLKKYGLAEINISYITKNDKEKLSKYCVELSVFLADANKKYKVFDDIINRLELYEKIVNEKLTFKHIKLTRESGIQVFSDDESPLTLDTLSSGEQQIIVLFFKLIFESNVQLLMIDEPEISLHIAWQKEILNDLKEVVKLSKGIQIIIATHSPQILSNNWDLQIDLGGQYNE